MADYAAMGKRVMHHRYLRAAAAAGLAAWVLAASGQAFAGSGPSTAPASGPGPSTTTTTLPPIPKVDPSLTDGQNPGKLLANAIELSSVGIDSSALTTAIAATQVKLDADAATASKAAAAADVANQQASEAL